MCPTGGTRGHGHADDILDVVLQPSQCKLAHGLHENTEVMEPTVAEDGRTTYRLRVASEKRARLDAQLRPADSSRR